MFPVFLNTILFLLMEKLANLRIYHRANCGFHDYFNGKQHHSLLASKVFVDIFCISKFCIFLSSRCHFGTPCCFLFFHGMDFTLSHSKQSGIGLMLRTTDTGLLHLVNLFIPKISIKHSWQGRGAKSAA